jgi:hypothetical protein
MKAHKPQKGGGLDSPITTEPDVKKERKKEGKKERIRTFFIMK